MIRTSIFACALGLPLLLAGCGTIDRLPLIGSSNDEPEVASPVIAAPEPVQSTFVAPAGTDTETAALMARMEELEQELGEVRIELSRQTTANEARRAAAEAEAERIALAAQAASLRPSDAAVPVVPASLSDTRFSVHLASYRNRDAAVEGWSELRQRFNPVLGSLDPRLTEVEIDGRGTFYRLKAGPFQSWGSANEVCDYLRTSSWSCAVMDFAGVDIN